MIAESKSGRKTSTKTDGCNLKLAFSTRSSKCFMLTDWPDLLKQVLPMNLFTGDLLLIKLLKEFEPYFHQSFGTQKLLSGFTKLWWKTSLGK